MTKWSHHKTARARKMYEAGKLSVQMIAASLRVDPMALIAKARASGWVKPGVAKVKKQAVKPAKVEAPKVEPLTGKAAQGRRAYVKKPAGQHHFNGFYGSNKVAQDARVDSYAPDLLTDIKALQRAGFVVYRIKPDLFMCGTVRLNEQAVREKAARYRRAA